MGVKSTVDADLQEEAAALVARLADDCAHGKPLGSMSVSFYDTAWLSMVRKENSDGDLEWLFPRSFQYLLDTQSPDGGWEHALPNAGLADEVDGILNTMAALLSLLKHRGDPESDSVEQRVRRAVAWLNRRLQKWDVSKTDHVAFELLVPTHLNLLRAEGITFRFPGRERLKWLNAAKLAKFRPELLFDDHPTTLIHSLEAFVGKVDFDKLRHRVEDGSMMYSPAATAAYLTNTSLWDDEAEAYLHAAHDHGTGSGNGAVPSTYPIEVLDISWVLSTLLGAGFTKDQLGHWQLCVLANQLEDALSYGGELAGFTCSVMPDADNTARALLSLQLLGPRNASPARLIETFQMQNAFRTYADERSPSFSANCNVLLALLHCDSPKQYTRTIQGIAEYLCNAWRTDAVQDQRNASSHHAYMLLAQAFSRLLARVDGGSLPDFSVILRDRVAFVQSQLLSRVLLSQKHDGSWGADSCEIAAYGILALKALVFTPGLSSYRTLTLAGIRAGRQYLLFNRDSWKKPSHVWIEKVTYGSAVLAETYCLAAAVGIGESKGGFWVQGGI